ncbi:alanine--tRNA ligase-related protein [Vibrio sp. VNB-15]
MTYKVFWDDPYQVELDSTVSSVDGNHIELEQTIFYAESGGQESDAGTIGGIQVVKAEKQGLSIVYTLEHQPSFCVGESVRTQIDWPRRYSNERILAKAKSVLKSVWWTHDLRRCQRHTDNGEVNKSNRQALN